MCMRSPVSVAAFGYIDTRLTADKGSSTLQIGNVKVPLGIPQAAASKEMMVQTLIPLRRTGTAQDAAGAVLMLAAPQLASYVSGHTLECTGGQGI